MVAYSDFGNLDVDESELDEDDEAQPFVEAISEFRPQRAYDAGRNAFENGMIGYQVVQEFADYCQSRRIDLRRLTDDDIASVVERVAECLPGWYNELHISQLIGPFEHRLRLEVEGRQKLYLDTLKTAEDASHVQAIGLTPRYRAWTCTQDSSVDGNGLIPARYYMPPGREEEVPMEEYAYLGAEVVSPVLPMDNEYTSVSILSVCGILRDNLRIHKPMELSTGLHVHLGHKHGWNLRQLKRFVTLWFLIEKVLLHIHRKDRTVGRVWCVMLSERSQLARCLFDADEDVRREYHHLLPKIGPNTKARYLAELSDHLPRELLDNRSKDFIEAVWNYPTIDTLVEPMNPGTLQGYGAVRIRISGGKKSDPAEAGISQTAEVRIMHGTVDGVHINHWIAVLSRIMYYVRQASTAEYAGLIEQILFEVYGTSKLWRLLQILEVPEETRRFYAHPYNRGADHKGEEWFMYPDKDRVDWGHPFAVPGHRATHGYEYNNLDPYP
ncbi:hypothetical protein F4804DRAFT_332744 [Jackrogersella minutella]|nr:hypothetical protein F4804DRAFT_332744 [Jackrogersella minutella]